MSYERGWKYLQTTTEDYTKTAKFYVDSRKRKKSDADKRADTLRNKGRNVRKIHENGWWVIYYR